MGNKKNNQASFVEIDKRVTDGVEAILEKNMSRAEWVIHCKENYGVESRQADNYWSKAKELIREKYAKDREIMVEKHHARLFELYMKALKDDEKEIARKILSDISKLTGVNEPDKKDVTSGGERIQINVGIEDE